MICACVHHSPHRGHQLAGGVAPILIPSELPKALAILEEARCPDPIWAPPFFPPFSRLPMLTLLLAIPPSTLALNLLHSTVQRHLNRAPSGSQVAWSWSPSFFFFPSWVRSYARDGLVL